MARKFKMRQQREEDWRNTWWREQGYNGSIVVARWTKCHLSYLALGYQLQPYWPRSMFCICGEVARGDFEIPSFIWGDDSDTWWCVLFAASPHRWQAFVPREYFKGRCSEDDYSIFGVYHGKCYWGGEWHQRCTCPVRLLEEDFQGASFTVVWGLMRVVWRRRCKSRGRMLSAYICCTWWGSHSSLTRVPTI